MYLKNISKLASDVLRKMLDNEASINVQNDNSLEVNSIDGKKEDNRKGYIVSI